MGCCIETQILLTLLLDDALFGVGAFYLVNLALLERSKACARMALAGSLLLLGAHLAGSAGEILAATWSYQAPLWREAQVGLAVPGCLGLMFSAGFVAAGRPRAYLVLPAGLLRPSLESVVAASQAAVYGAFALLAVRKGHAAPAVCLLLAALAGLASGDGWTTELAHALGLTGLLRTIAPSAGLVQQALFALGLGLLYAACRREREAELERYLEAI